MAVNLTRKTIVGAKTETTSGTAATGFDYAATTGGTSNQTQLVYGDGAGVWQADTTMVDMPSLTGTLSPQKQLAGRSLANVSLQTCLIQPSVTTEDATNVVPFYDPLLKACGMSATTPTTPSWNVVYTPESTMGESSDVVSATVEVYQGGTAGTTSIKTTATGCYMNADFNLTAGQAPTIQFTGQGRYVDPVTATAPTAAYPSDNKTLVESELLTIANADTPAVKLVPICRSLTFATGNSIIERGDINSDEGLAGLMIISRAATLNLVIEAETDLPTAFTASNATGPFFGNMKSNDLHTISFTHKTTATITAIFSFPTAQLTSVNMSDDGGIRVFNLSYALVGGSSGDDEYSITFTNPTA